MKTRFLEGRQCQCQCHTHTRLLLSSNTLESCASMENVMGLLRIKVKRGINLAVRDARSSDPYLVITMAHQKLKTRVVKKTCNPDWNDELTLSISDPNIPIKLTVYDKDTITGDDKMGDAEVDIKPYLASMRMGLQNLPTGCVVSRVQPTRQNCLADESSIVWENGKITQHMILRLNNVECGEVELQLEWIEFAGSKGLGTQGTS
ncbi:protein C2-DOMAIN ABA-RELATED 7-like isoform X1 [Tripterygium wilfordii]|uniref:protein C2-DOMAIN ABA-RELATED 7-like isoform X1 n=2 Tax=Tripterygium wilfordii TaxID=458696 RepID=UPI0018F7F8D4|nr:protein C2-DOMAIN ABA-RELATED 7-like isoform X1 [Tripterygium wilfordii]